MKKILFIILLSAYCNLYAAEELTKKVLILHSYQQGYEWGDKINKGIMDTFRNYDNLEVYVENMDILRNSSADYLHALEELYSVRFARDKIKFDVIITADDPAFNFILSLRKKLFYDIPLVFCGVNDFIPARIKGQKKITGVNESISIKETVEIALRIREKSDKIAVVSGSGVTYAHNLETFRKAAASFADRTEIVYLTELEPEVLAGHLKKLGPDDIVIYLGYLQTPSGKKFSVQKSIELIRNSTDAAIFGCWDFLIPHGVVGGKVVHGYTQGETAAEMALEVLKGKRIEDIPIMMKSPNKYLFDDVMLHKYNMPEKLLPTGSLVVNQSAENVIRDWNKNKLKGFFGYHLFENHGSIMMLIDPANGVIVDANRAACNFYGHYHLVGKKISEINILPPDELKTAINKIRDLKQNKFQFVHRLADGQFRSMEVHSYPVEINGREFLFSVNYDITDKMNAENAVKNRNHMIFGIIITALIVLLCFTIFLVKNISGRKKSELSLKKSERKFDIMLRTMVEGMVTVNGEGRINYSNPAAEEILGIGKDILGKYYQSREWSQIDSNGLPYPQDKLPLYIALNEKRPVSNVEHMIKASDGEVKWLSVNAAPLFDHEGTFIGGIASFRDITVQKKSEERIKNLLAEKELLLHEVHHRIKNNMNTIKGLLTLQLSAEENPTAAASIQDAESRVQSMIMLYDRLYSTENFREMSVKDYIQPLAYEIVGSFPNSAKVEVITDIEDFILNVKSLSPLGIIINELLTNMMKYAFPGRASGIIKLSASMRDNHVKVQVEDNGVGIPETVSFNKSTGFGLELVDMLTAQLGGSIRIKRGDGTVFELEFDV